MLKIRTKNKVTVDNLVSNQVVNVEFESLWNQGLNRSDCEIEFKDESGEVFHQDKHSCSRKESQDTFNNLRSENEDITPVDVWWYEFELEVKKVLGDVEFERIID